MSIFGRAYYRKDICVCDWGAYFREGLFFYFSMLNLSRLGMVKQIASNTSNFSCDGYSITPNIARHAKYWMKSSPGLKWY